MDLIRIIYSSQPFGFDESILRNVLLDARRWNERSDVSGALICRHDIYLQYLEGPAKAVGDAFERIRRDDRHIEVVMRVSEPVDARLFGKWSMMHDPARSWIWNEDDIAKGALDNASDDQFRKIFTDLATQAASPAAD